MVCLLTSLCRPPHQIGATVREVYRLYHGVPESDQIQPGTEPGSVMERLKLFPGETFENRAQRRPLNIGPFESVDNVETSFDGSMVKIDSSNGWKARG